MTTARIGQIIGVGLLMLISAIYAVELINGISKGYVPVVFISGLVPTLVAALLLAVSLKHPSDKRLMMIALVLIVSPLIVAMLNVFLTLVLPSSVSSGLRTIVRIVNLGLVAGGLGCSVTVGLRAIWQNKRR